ncbi:MAG: hypothetical protein JRI23_19385 [Deltaproteobacteria bacterium]|jgi:hypothetical protein|nr:hypothetical protein [Deltaproteobacteria bacterium]MBW2534028.1 hypothetical protein [Deltaproteobacteria bacterium]
MAWVLDHLPWLVGVPAGLGWLALIAARMIRARLASRAEHRALRRELGAALEALDASRAHATVTVGGRLHRISAPVERLDDGYPAAAITAAASRRPLWMCAPTPTSAIHDCAEKLQLRVGEREVDLSPPIHVLCGSRHYYSGRRLARHEAALRMRMPPEQLIGFEWERARQHYAVFRSIDGGDAVLVRGRLVRQRERAGEESTYREASGRWSLEPAEPTQELQLVAEHPPRTRWRWSAPLDKVAPVLIGAAVLVAVIAASAYESAVEVAEKRCRATEDCTSSGACSADLVGHWPFAFRCIPLRDSDCTGSTECKERGKCSVDRELSQCTAATDADCGRSSVCRSRHVARCRAVEGECRASEKACRASTGCRFDGKCQYDADTDRCRVGSSDDCQRSLFCRDYGRCAAIDGKCKPATDEHCQKSLHCKWRGRCSPEMGQCIAKHPDDCKQADVCAKGDRCHVMRGYCHSVESARSLCSSSRDCKQRGACSPTAAGACEAASEADCRSSDACSLRGCCFADGGQCVARSADDCRRSLDCKELGACTLRGARCVESSR